MHSKILRSQFRQLTVLTRMHHVLRARLHLYYYTRYYLAGVRFFFWLPMFTFTAECASWCPSCVSLVFSLPHHLIISSVVFVSCSSRTLGVAVLLLSDFLCYSLSSAIPLRCNTLCFGRRCCCRRLCVQGRFCQDFSSRAELCFVQR